MGFEEAERDIVGGAAPAPAALASLQGRREQQKRTVQEIAELEVASLGSRSRHMTAVGALATLAGKSVRYLITKPEISIGRSTNSSQVDVDLAAEGGAGKVSRLQASLKLAQDGHFYLHNLGRKGLQVSGKAVPAGSRCRLFDGCFLEVQGSWVVKGDVEIDTGANPSAEGGDDDIGGGSNEQKVVDIIDAFELVEQGEYGKKDLMSYFKGWIGSVMEHIAEDDKADFKKRVQGGVKKLVGLCKELQVFTGPSMDPDATMVFAYYKEGASAPTFIYFKDAMKEIKC